VVVPELEACSAFLTLHRVATPEVAQTSTKLCHVVRCARYVMDDGRHGRDHTRGDRGPLQNVGDCNQYFDFAPDRITLDKLSALILLSSTD